MIENKKLKDIKKFVTGKLLRELLNL